MVARNLLLVPMRVNGSPSNPIREAVEAVSLAHAIHGRVGRLVRVVVTTASATREPGFAELLVSVSPEVES